MLKTDDTDNAITFEEDGKFIVLRKTTKGTIVNSENIEPDENLFSMANIINILAWSKTGYKK
jgi:hypothetical protein